LKNLGKTIDRLIKIDPKFEKELIPIKSKWERCPSKTMSYWKELLKFLNSNTLLNHPKRSEIKDVLNSKKKSTKQLNSFDVVLPGDIIVGLIPENISDSIRKHDYQTINNAKLAIEANMTHNTDMLHRILRKEAFLEISTKKIWVALKDYFKLWNKVSNFSIKIKDNMLVLVELLPIIPQNMMGNPAVIKMDPNTMRNFFKFLGLNPPEDLIPPEGQISPNDNQ
jgi:hypothetical protein